MKYTALILLINLLVTGCLGKSKKLNVGDYYKMLPDKYFTCFEEGRPVPKRLEAIKVKDVRNGYLSTEGLDGLHMAVFNDRSQKRKLVIVSTPCGYECNCDALDAYEVKEKKLKPISDIFPDIKEGLKTMHGLGPNDPVPFEHLGYEVHLPQHGTEVKVKLGGKSAKWKLGAKGKFEFLR